ncbi:YsnF/AvaK domain-containing protein [Luteipulveratus sp. YIM 133132]|uniref:YsnF/AvaK domain-containing protein n=1 Tax=Luteipulveratus flavus TaxID=3031728 RepID=UPI0023AE7100|nr:YsnF/AvaK domain-containing protein [Luteipulveratus sp. YIM 133132]MDE9364970.1 YsnF/AvaK domain-containing protein [Luteipulveratus sp. YIM 133132]
MTQYDVEQPTPAADQTDETPLAAGADDLSVVRHEERLDVSKERRAAGKVRIGKRTVTETVQVPVQVRREVLVYEELPVEGGDTLPSQDGEATAAHPDGTSAVPHPADGTDHGAVDGLPSAPTEVVLHEERPVVSLETVPVERVRLVPSTTDAEHTVTQPVRREEVELVRTDDEPTAS